MTDPARVTDMLERAVIRRPTILRDISLDWLRTPSYTVVGHRAIGDIMRTVLHQTSQGRLLAEDSDVPMRKVLVLQENDDGISQVRVDALLDILKLDGRFDEVGVIGSREFIKVLGEEVAADYDRSLQVSNLWIDGSYYFAQIMAHAAYPVEATLGHGADHLWKWVVGQSYQATYDLAVDWIAGRSSIALQPFNGLHGPGIKHEEYSLFVEALVERGFAVVICGDFALEKLVLGTRIADPDAEFVRRWSELFGRIESEWQGRVLLDGNSGFTEVIAYGRACDRCVTEITRTLGWWMWTTNHVIYLEPHTRLTDPQHAGQYWATGLDRDYNSPELATRAHMDALIDAIERDERPKSPDHESRIVVAGEVPA